MSHVEDNQEEISVVTLVRQMEGAENNAFVTGILLEIFEDIVTKNKISQKDQYDIAMGTLLEINKGTFEEHQKYIHSLPEEDQDLLLSGALSAQENFYNILNMAYSESLVIPLEERIDMVRDVMRNHIAQIEELVAEPLAEIRAALAKQAE